MSAWDLGIDVGSTTVKVVVEAPTAAAPTVVYLRHRGDPVATVRRALVKHVPPTARVRPFVTGSGAPLVAERWQIPQVSEIAAITAVVAARHPATNAIFELGAQDAKIVAFERDARGAVKRTAVASSERCAAGAGATIDRCLLRLGADPLVAAAAEYIPERVHRVAVRCGAFAEAELVKRARAGASLADVVLSLADALVAHHLVVLGRGITLSPTVLLLGGPAVHLRAVEGACRHRVRELWRDRRAERGGACDVIVPPEALFFGAQGALLAGAARHSDSFAIPLPELLARAGVADPPRTRIRLDRPLAAREDEVRGFLTDYATPRRPRRPRRRPGAYLIGIDAGSSMVKGVVATRTGKVLATAARVTVDPLTDARAVVDELKAQVEARGQPFEIAALGITGNAGKLLSPALMAEVQVADAVAHARAARAAAPNADVVCVVGGQEIAVLSLDGSGAIRDVRTSTTCSSGLGVVLEAVAREFAVPLAEFADRALAARRAPWFGDGCAVLLDANRASFQREGFTPDEILAGLAQAVPRVIWSQVAAGVQPSALGRVFVLQGGVQRNLGAVKAQLDFLRRALPEAQLVVHPYAAEAAALGAALCAADALRGDRRPLAGDLFAEGTPPPTTPACRICPEGCPRASVELVV